MIYFIIDAWRNGWFASNGIDKINNDRNVMNHLLRRQHCNRHRCIECGVTGSHRNEWSKNSMHPTTPPNEYDKSTKIRAISLTRLWRTLRYNLFDLFTFPINDIGFRYTSSLLFDVCDLRHARAHKYVETILWATTLCLTKWTNDEKCRNDMDILYLATWTEYVVVLII